MEERSLLIGNNVGSSAIKPAATIGIMAVKILQETEKNHTKENREKKNTKCIRGSVVVSISCFVIPSDPQCLCLTVNSFSQQFKI